MVNLPAVPFPETRVVRQPILGEPLTLVGGFMDSDWDIVDLRHDRRRFETYDVSAGAAQSNGVEHFSLSWKRYASAVIVHPPLPVFTFPLPQGWPASVAVFLMQRFSAPVRLWLESVAWLRPA